MSDFNADPTDEQPPDVSSLDTTRAAWTPIPTLRYSSITAWGRLLSGTLLSVGGIVAGAYVLRNVEQPTGWAITSFSVGAAGVYLTGMSLCKLWCTTSREGVYNLEHETAADYEETYFAENPDTESRSFVLAQFDLFSRQNSETTPPTSSEETSDFPQVSVSDVSSDVLNLNLGNYIPRSTDLSFRPSDKDEGKRKKCLRKEWSSAPTILQKQTEDFVISLNLNLNIEKETEEAQGPRPAQLQADAEVMERSPSEESFL